MDGGWMEGEREGGRGREIACVRERTARMAQSCSEGSSAGGCDVLCDVLCRSTLLLYYTTLPPPRTDPMARSCSEGSSAAAKRVTIPSPAV